MFVYEGAGDQEQAGTVSQMKVTSHNGVLPKTQIILQLEENTHLVWNINEIKEQQIYNIFYRVK